MTSGYMWNQIRRPPYVQPAHGGKVNYVAPGYSNQLGAETHIVSTICEYRTTLKLSGLGLILCGFARQMVS